MNSPAPPSGAGAHYRSDKSTMGEDNAGYLIKLVHNSLNRMLDQQMAPLGLTAMQWRPIAMVALKRADTPAELSRLCGVDSGAMTRALDRLEAKGLLRRVRSHGDRRVVKIELTESGLATAQQIPPYLAGTLNHHLRGFSTDEVQQLKHFLLRMLANGSPDGASER